MVIVPLQPASEMSLVTGMVEQGILVSLRGMPGDGEAEALGGISTPSRWPAAPCHCSLSPPQAPHLSCPAETHKRLILLRVAPGAPPSCRTPKEGPRGPPTARPVLTFLAAAVGHEGDGALGVRGGGMSMRPQDLPPTPTAPGLRGREAAAPTQRPGQLQSRPEATVPALKTSPPRTRGPLLPAEQTQPAPGTKGSPGGRCWGRSQGS